jgi:hypothetical protein
MWDDALEPESKRLDIPKERVFDNYTETKCALKRASVRTAGSKISALILMLPHIVGAR